MSGIFSVDGLLCVCGLLDKMASLTGSSLGDCCGWWFSILYHGLALCVSIVASCAMVASSLCAPWAMIEVAGSVLVATASWLLGAPWAMMHLALCCCMVVVMGCVAFILGC
jgi:hypothetical protein